MKNDKYTIEPLEVGSTVFGSFKVGDWLLMENCGLVTPINGPYCSWPKAEPRYFRVTINEK